jgi:hypothetical protein
MKCPICENEIVAGEDFLIYDGEACHELCIERARLKHE